MYILGINAVFHDSSACLLKDGVLLAAAEEERFTQIKHGKRPVPFTTWELPFHAIDYCLSVAGITLDQVDHITYSFDPYQLIPPGEEGSPQTQIPFFQDGLQKGAGAEQPWENLFLSYIVNAGRQLVDGYPHHLQKRFIDAKPLRAQWHFLDHHLCHAASAFHPSPFSRAAILTLDGRGERAGTTYSVGLDNDIQRIAQVNLPHSLGLLYEQVTTYLGFLHSSDEYKVMALASYGSKDYVQDFQEIIKPGPGGSYEIAPARLTERFGPPRRRNEALSRHHFSIAHSLQHVLEERVEEMLRWFQKETQEENLCMAGGVALNCVLNGRMRQKNIFKNIWVQPASGDAGTALGGATWLDYKLRQRRQKTFQMDHVYWGPGFDNTDIESFLRWAKVPYTRMENRAEQTAQILADGKIIGWFQGRMEFGPRALGSRSILASPIPEDMKSRLNEVKDREDFRPVAPVIMEEHASEWFEMDQPSPFMLFVYKVRPEKKAQIPAVCHTDETARVQTVNAEQHPAYYELLSAFKQKTGVPVLINTSFNTLSKPIVCSVRDAVACFWTSPFDALVIGDYLIEKHGNKN